MKIEGIKSNKNRNKVILLSFVVIFVGILVMLLLKLSSKAVVTLSPVNVLENLTISSITKETITQAQLQEPKSVNASVPIFMYHFVREDTGDYEFPENMTRPDTLRKQLEYLKDNGYETINGTDIGNLQVFSKPVWLTFDDGWEDFYLNAFPIFKEFNMKASLYVITSLLDTPGYCKLEQLKEMKESGLIDIQSHTVTHPRLASLTNEKIVSELNESKKYLKEKLAIDSKVICYPYGSFSQMVIRESQNAAYEYGLAMDGGVYHTSIHKDKYAIPRIYANRSMTLNTFANYVKQSKVEVVW